MDELKRLVVTEVQPENTWLLNIDTYNDATDVEIPEELAKHILGLQAAARQQD